MSKFKVGDRVRVDSTYYHGYPAGSPYNLPRGEGVVWEAGEDDGFIKVKYDGIVSPPVNPDCFDLVVQETKLPIRTITRREIVYGAYGEEGHKIFLNPAGTSTMVQVTTTQRMSKNHLRAAAKLFNDLADVLEENAEAA